MAQETNSYKLGVKDVYAKLKTSSKGLREKEAAKRLEKYGFNELKERRRIDPIQIFFAQFKNFLVLILILAVTISIAIQHYNDALLIGLILIGNAVLGFSQEYRAEKALLALKKMHVLKAVVIRDGVEKEIEAKHLVPGDIIVLQEGEKVPADARLIECVNLKTDEAALTGDSVSIEKCIKPMVSEKPLAEQANMVFMNTIVAFGRGKAIVTKTGMASEFGKIAGLIQEIKETKSPLTKRIEGLGKFLGGLVIAITIAITIILLLTKGLSAEIFLTAISLAVSAIPEGLPAVVTITLTLGARQMAKEKTIVRKMTAIETLGSTTVICSDKTGTLTRNEMTVKEIALSGKTVTVSGEGYKTEGEFLLGKKTFSPLKEKDMALMLKTGVLCNNANIGEAAEEFIGDPTEIALLVAGRKAGLSKESLKDKFLSELPFDSERKMMSVIYKSQAEKAVVYSKGSVESILGKSSFILRDGKKEKLSKAMQEQILRQNAEMASHGLRVLAFAFRGMEAKELLHVEGAEKKLVFLGLMAMADSLREESRKAVELSRQAGIEVKMVTGDHKLTAVAIAKELGLLGKNEDAEKKVITGIELSKLKDDELLEKVKEVVVFARVSPKHKLRIVSALREQGEVVAVTGDGVNDAPALKKADIGVAMGITGTDVSKEASDMIILDDDFSTIVKAIAQGRRIYANIKAFLKFLLASNVNELVIITATALAGLPLALLPVQILWINLVTDSFPALALSSEPLSKEAMQQKPRNPKESILHNLFGIILITGLVATAASLAGYFIGLNESVEKARTMTFTICVMFEMFFVLNCRQEGKSFLEIPFFSNPLLLVAIAVSILLQVMVIYTPFLQHFFHTVPFNLADWAVVISLSASGLIIPYIHRAFRLPQD